MKLVIDPSVLVVIVLAACLACIYMVFFFGRRLQTTAYIRDSLIEGAQQQELKTLLLELRNRAESGPLDPSRPPPRDYGSTRSLWSGDRATASPAMPSSYYDSIDEPPDRKARREAEQKQEEARQAAIAKWEDEERQRYEELHKAAVNIALERARKRVPSSIDISLLGGGWSFLLEFSTVIVIIFALLILGILNILDGREIATILAAIAGYVLGKATSNTTGSSKKQAGSAIPDSPRHREPTA